MSLSDALVRSFAKALRERAVAAAPPPSLEEFVTSPEYCAFPTASDTQRALLQAADGLIPVLTRERMEYHFGSPTFTPGERPKTVIARCGVRSGKSLLAALCSLVHGALYCDASRVRPGELVRALIAAPRFDLSAVTFKHAIGTMEKSPRLSQYLVSAGIESARIRRPDGVEIDLRLVAASKGGKNLRSTWLAGCVFDEADFHDSEDAAVNLPENYDAVGTRMLPGSQIWIVSSPFADAGPYHKLFTEYFGAPHGGAISFHSDTASMNARLRDFLSEKEEADLRARDPDKAGRELDAIPISSSAADFFPIAAVRACTNKARTGDSMHLSPDGRAPHWAGTDLGFRKNSSAIALARSKDGRVVLAYHDEKRPNAGQPLKPSEVISDFAQRCLDYTCTSIRGDYHYVDTALEEFPKHKNASGMQVVYDPWAPTIEAQTEAFSEFRRLMLEGLLELPDDPRLLLQIEKTRSKPYRGGLQVVLPKIGHTHGDVLMAVVLACTQVPTKPRGDASAWGGFHSDSRWGGGGRGFG